MTAERAVAQLHPVLDADDVNALLHAPARPAAGGLRRPDLDGESPERLAGHANVTYALPG